MAISIIPTFIRKYFARAFNNGEAVDATMLAAIDAMFADLVTQGNQNKARLEAISTAAGTLRYSLTQSQRFVATASQTAFTMSSTYDHANDLVAAWTNSGSGNVLSRIDDSLITRTSDTVVTLPAQALNAIVVIDIRSAGNGTSQLASITPGQGAGLVGYSDPNGLAAGANVETALAELFADINDASFLGGIIGLTGYIKKDGSVAFTGDQAMGGHKLTGLGAGSASSNDAARMADITAANLFATLSSLLNGNFLPLAGGTMTGDIDMNGKKAVNAVDGSDLQDYATVGQIPNMVGAGKNAITNGSGIVANGTALASTTPGAFIYGLVESCKGALDGTTVTGSLTRSIASLASLSGYAIRWEAVTTTGAGLVKFRFFVESRDAARFINRKASLGLKFWQSTGGNITVVANIYKATSPDVFASLTLIQASPAITVHQATATDIQLAGVDMGACEKGICVEIVATVGAVTGATFEVSEVQLEIGSICSPFEYESYAATLLRCQRLFTRIASADANTVFGQGSASSGTLASVLVPLPVEMRLVPTLTLAITNLELFDGATAAVAVTVIALAATYNSKNMIALDVQVAAGLTAWRPYFLKANNTVPHIDLDARF